ncbi:hypothetical protein FISHEDRAFT_59279 [Fistulina hepatica ATCC 64428]|uniref:Uncharacterized protein n=1 Tax=Fistulina hepatica ATCC 64428 TaxID=1128425 RepID=A0A0D7AAC0_9AGAR|nr:hypothetical protein FISHEDRAFT_59279 [Fistulina hepatica ATCC 64428]
MPQPSTSPPSTSPRSSSPPTSNHASSPDAEEHPEDEITRLRRIIKGYELGQAAEGRKRKSSGNKVGQPGRGFRQLVTLFDTPNLVIYKAERYLERHRATERRQTDPNTAEDELEDLESNTLTTEEKQSRDRDEYRAYMAYRSFHALIPGLKEKLGGLDEDGLDSYLLTVWIPAKQIVVLTVTQISHAGDAAKNTNTSDIRAAVARWINQEIDEDAMRNPDERQPRHLEPETRMFRGLAHDKTGAYLCPVDLDGNWDEESFRGRVRNNEPGAQISSSWFFRALYATGSGHKDDIETGFLRGPLLVKTAQYIFTSPSSVKETDDENSPPSKKAKVDRRSSARSDVAHRRGMDGQMTPRAIAYCAVLLHFNLTDCDKWPQDGMYMAFNYNGLYNFVVDYFEQDATDEADKQHVSELLSWWNSQVFPNSVKSTSITTVQSANKLAAQRAARRATSGHGDGTAAS